jgi:type IV pilus assembly protein PilC
MERFRYLAYNAAGGRVSDSVAAMSPDEVKRKLWSDGLYVVKIERARWTLPTLEEAFPTFVRVKRSEVILFTKQLATFVRVGIPMMEGLNVLREQASTGIMQRALGDITAQLGSGVALSDAMAKFPAIFSNLYVDMIRSAEVSGNLDDVLRQLAGYMSRDEGSMRKVRSAMVYPAIVIGLATVVIGVLIGFVLPAFANLFRDFRATMPLPTRILLATGSFCRDHMIGIFLTIAISVVVIVLAARTRRGRELLDAVLLRLPMLGTIVRYSIVERYLRTLATLARAGVPITTMLDTANRSLGNSVFRRGLRAVRPQMLSGEGFARPLARTGLFPQIVIQMVKVGEETGNLDANLEEAADHYAEEVDFRLKQMIAMMEPALVVAVGAMVGFIAISVIAPMYSLVHAVK